MSALVLRYRNELAVRSSQDIIPKEPEYISVSEEPEKVLVIETDLGFALGYVDSLGAIDTLYRRNRAELDWHSKLIDLYEPHADGRSVVRVFDLAGAMRLCELAKTPMAALLYNFLSKMAFGRMIEEEARLPRAKVLPFPSVKTQSADVLMFKPRTGKGAL